jgi:hypothetical protein
LVFLCLLPFVYYVLFFLPHVTPLLSFIVSLCISPFVMRCRLLTSSMAESSIASGLPTETPYAR